MMRCPSRTSIPVVSVSSTTSRIQCPPLVHHQLHPAVGQLISQLVLRMTAVALYSAPFNMVLADQLVQRAPLVGVLDRLATVGIPVAIFPVGQPFADALHHVLRVCGQ